MGDPRLHSRVDENTRCVQGSGEARASAMMSDGKRTMTGTDDGEDVIELVKRNNKHTLKRASAKGATVASQTRRQDGEGKRA